MAHAKSKSDSPGKLGALFDHAGPSFHYSFFPIPDNSSNRHKTKQAAANMERLESRSQEGLSMDYSKSKGWAIRATRKFLKDDVVLRYCGNLVTAAKGYEIEEKLRQAEIADSYLFFFKHDSREMCLDATKDDGLYGRLVNHSRIRPNCKAAGFMVGRETAVGIVAIRDIVAGEEILYDYGDTRNSVAVELPWFEES